MRKVEPYNPLDKKNLAESAASALLRQEPEILPPEPFEGAGIYAIYYMGEFPAYRPLAEKNRERLEAPIYVGKADPKGGRRGGELDAPVGAALSDRLRKHARSIEQANNLDLSDFRCRYLVLDDVWVRMAERMLIAWYNRFGTLSWMASAIMTLANVEQPNIDHLGIFFIRVALG